MRLRLILTISAIGTMAACFMFLLGPSASETGATGANGRQYTTVVIDGCEYIQRAYDGHTFHKGGCRNPIHWQHVLQDTSWWRSVRPIRDSNLEIHTPKGNCHEEEDRGL